MKSFKVINGCVIPPIDNEYLKISKWYFGKTKTMGGEIKKCLVAWDFKKHKWIYCRSGHCEVIEYYTE